MVSCMMACNNRTEQSDVSEEHTHHTNSAGALVDQAHEDMMAISPLLAPNLGDCIQQVANLSPECCELSDLPDWIKRICELETMTPLMEQEYAQGPMGDSNGSTGSGESSTGIGGAPIPPLLSGPLPPSDDISPITQEYCTREDIPASDGNLYPYCDEVPLVIVPTIVGTDLPGDGLVPLLNSDRTRMFLTFHHSTPQIDNLYCHELTGTMQPCAGYPQPITMGNVNSFVSNTGGAIVAEDKIYINSYNSADNFGISCWDMNNDVSCGYVQLGPTAGKVAMLVNLYRGASSTLERVGNRLYLLDRQMQLHCVDLNLNPCGSPYPLDLNTLYGLPTANTIATFGTGLYTEVVGQKVYFSILNGPYPNCKAFCLDTTTDSACSNWANPTPSFTDCTVETNLQTFIAYDTNAQPVGFCREGPSCIRLSDGMQDDSLAPLLGSDLYSQEDTFLTSTGERITVYANWFTMFGLAYNWSTQVTNVYVKDVGNYGAYVDDTGCAWFGSHDNVIWQLAAYDLPPSGGNSADIGCPGYSAATTIRPENYSCTNTFFWDSIRIYNLQKSQFITLEMIILDENDMQLGPTVNLLSTRVVDISGPLYSDQPELKLVIQGLNDTSATITNPPYVQTTFKAPPEEVCCVDPPVSMSDCR